MCPDTNSIKYNLNLNHTKLTDTLAQESGRDYMEYEGYNEYEGYKEYEGYGEYEVYKGYDDYMDFRKGGIYCNECIRLLK